MALAGRWAELWRRLGAVSTTPDVAALLRAYSEPHRRYHTLQHLEECFAALDAAPLHEAKPLVECALWYHDAVYDPRRADNERLSADWAARDAAAAGLAVEVGASLERLIMRTQHAEAPRADDERLLVDVDLAILGAPASRFDEYERQVRDEYGWVPGFVFRRKRREILAGLLARPALFSTPWFAARLEAAARANLARSLAALE